MKLHTDGLTPRASRSSKSGVLALWIIVCLLAAPIIAPAQGRKAQKNFKQGLQHEAAQRWESAAEEFATALATDPANVEYQLHYRRALFNASQQFTQQGQMLAEKGDHAGAYHAFRRAHNYDASNRLALSLMERMLQLQLGESRETPPTPQEPPTNTHKRTEAVTASQITQAAFTPERKQNAASITRNIKEASTSGDDALPSTRVESARVINFSGDLKDFIRMMAQHLELNVVFDRDFPKRLVSVELRSVTPAQALDYVFRSQGVFFQKLGRGTILVASGDQAKRQQHQELVIRTFYLSNLNAEDARTHLLATFTAQGGKQIVVNKPTNSLTVRDTAENVRLMSEVLKGIDKERAEVVIDVQIFEVSRTDLMQLGHQLGTDAALSNLGGVTKGFSILGGSREVVTQGAGAIAAPTAMGAALLLPATTLTALHRKEQTRLLASTQLHAFDGEKSTAHIGQRVPVQTASVATYGAGASGDGKDAQPGVNTGIFGGTGFPVINYEKTGLTLEFTPQIFPNLDVQVKMAIKSNDIANQGVGALTPVFTERTIEGTARIENNRTMMLASVAQNNATRGRSGLPIVGLIPVLGRLFTAPRRSDQQTDIVIAVTPRVQRAPVITPQDETPHPSGTTVTPADESLEAMVREEEREAQLAAARRLPRDVKIEIEAESATDAVGYSYVPAPRELKGAVNSAENTGERNARLSDDGASPRAVQAEFVAANKTAAAATTAEDASSSVVPAPTPIRTIETEVRRAALRSAAQLKLLCDEQLLRVGDKTYLKVMLKTDAPLHHVSVALNFDSRVIAIRGITPGRAFGGTQFPLLVVPMIEKAGTAFVTVTPPSRGAVLTGAGVIFMIEVEAVGVGDTEIKFTETNRFVAIDDRQVQTQLLSKRLIVN